MNSEELIKLYKKIDEKEIVTPYKDSLGFSIIKNYDIGSDYHKSGKKMMIKISIRENNLISGGIDMVHDSEEKGYYVVDTGEEFNKKITGFYFSSEEKFRFDFSDNKIVRDKRNINLPLNKFIKVLIYNHLQDRLFLKKKLNKMANYVLKFLFLLSDKKYNEVSVMIKRFDRSPKTPSKLKDVKHAEPFFKYFHISKNLLFFFSILTFIVLLYLTRNTNTRDYSISNPILLFSLFLLLFCLEKISTYLDDKIDRFYDKKNNFITKIFNFKNNNRFPLKFPKRIA